MSNTKSTGNRGESWFSGRVGAGPVQVLPVIEERKNLGHKGKDPLSFEGYFVTVNQIVLMTVEFLQR